MATKNLGKVFMTPKGQWDKTLSYTKLDIVTNKIGKVHCISNKKSVSVICALF